MTLSPLAIRLSRRVIASAQLMADQLGTAEGRHLTSRPEAAIAAVLRYVGRLMDLQRPSQLILNIPRAVSGSRTDRIAQALEALGVERGIPVLTVSRPELLAAYGMTALRSRKELRDLVRGFWPALADIKRTVEPYVADAAATALYADCRWALRGPSP